MLYLRKTIMGFFNLTRQVFSGQVSSKNQLLTKNITAVPCKNFLKRNVANP
jgi:hypothetical protein